MYDDIYYYIRGRFKAIECQIPTGNQYGYVLCSYDRWRTADHYFGKTARGCNFFPMDAHAIWNGRDIVYHGNVNHF